MASVKQNYTSPRRVVIQASISTGASWGDWDKKAANTSDQLSFYYSERITKFKIFCNKCMPRSQHAKGKVRMIGSRNSFESQSLNIGESIPGAI